MGLIYVSSDSTTLINALKANIRSGKEAAEQLKSGSQKIVSAVDGKTLSGAAYTAGKGLFSDLIIPTISKVSASVDELETELTKYTSADQKVSSEGTLDQDKLEQKIAHKKTMKSAVDMSLAAAKAASKIKPVDAMLHAQSSLTSMSNSYENDIRELQKKLEKLQQFSSETSGLFSNSLSNLKLAMQSVTILNNTIVHPDGTYQLPAGIALSWFDQLKAQDGTDAPNKDKQPDVGNREYKLIDLGYGKLWMWVEKGKNYATSEDIDVTLAYNEWVSRMIDKHGASFLIGEHQEGFFDLFLRQNATILKELSTGIDSVTGKPLTTQDRLFKMTTLANSMLTAGVAIKGVADVGQTSNKKASRLETSVPKDYSQTRNYWTETKDFDNIKVYQRNDLIDVNLIDSTGRTNAQRMKQGLAPIGPDGKSINLHHTTQRNTSSIAEVTQSFHQTNTKNIHINPPTIPSGIDRSQFNAWKKAYWKDRILYLE